MALSDLWPRTRKQATEDGVLIDATAQVRQMGFKLYEDYLIPPAGLEGEGHSLFGRLHDLLFRTLIAAKTEPSKEWCISNI